MSESAKTILRAGLGFSLAAFFISKVISSSGVNIYAEIMKGTVSLILIAFSLYGVCALIATFRWKLLLGVQGVYISFLRLYQLSMIGTFFNLVIPGAVSGDVVKMFYIRRHATDDRSAEAMLTIFLDRVLGLVGLFIVAIVSIMLSFEYLLIAAKQIQLCAITIVICSMCLLSLMLGVTFRAKLLRIRAINQLVQVVSGKLPKKFIDIVNRLSSAIDTYHGKRSIILKSVILSMMIHIIIGFVLVIIGKCFQENFVEWYNYVLATQTANAVGAIPITPSGIGSRDFVLSLFLRDAGAEKEKAAVIPMAFTIIIAAWSLIGGFFYIFHKRHVANANKA